MTINGRFAGGDLQFTIGGTTADAYNALVVNGSAALSGYLTVNAVNGFTPTSGQSVTLFTATGRITGTFSSSVSLPGTMTLQYGANAVKAIAP